MTLRRILLAVPPLAAAFFLAGCINNPGGDTVCPDQGARSANWPYCSPSNPGGPGPADDPIDPTGGRRY